jgi:hypothetical protein
VASAFFIYFSPKYLSLNKKWLPYVVILALGLLLFFVRRANSPRKTESGHSAEQKRDQDPSAKVNRNHGFDRRVSYLEYTRHAKCRMQCRRISQEEVEQIMREGTINYRKTDVNARPCPSYALEGITKDEQRVRIVFGQCDLKTKVITCIDLETDWTCECPGDDEKYKNRN